MHCVTLYLPLGFFVLSCQALTYGMVWYGRDVQIVWGNLVLVPTLSEHVPEQTVHVALFPLDVVATSSAVVVAFA